MKFSIKRKVDNLGRITIPKDFREYYHMKKHEFVCLVDTKEGLLITNPNYKVANTELEK